MRTEICDQLEIEFPIFAFSHCRDVVAAASQAGGFGVLGAVGFTPEQLAQELQWIDEHVGDHPYGVDVVLPVKDAGEGETDPDRLWKKLRAQVPDEHLAFAKKILDDAGVPELPPGEPHLGQITRSNSTTARLHVAEALRHDKVRLIANALGAPPADLVETIRGSGRLIAGLCGNVEHARRHAAAGVDIIVAQGGEAGGHTGTIGSIVLWPQVVEAVAPVPVLAAGGIGNGAQIAAALAMGAQGVWAGSLWLATEESELPPPQRNLLIEATSGDTVRSRSQTGKPARMLRSGWTEAWERPDTPDPLGLPLQDLVSGEAVTRNTRYADLATSVMITPVGQVVGQLNRVKRTRDVINELVEEYIAASTRLEELNAGQASSK